MPSVAMGEDYFLCRLIMDIRLYDRIIAAENARQKVPDELRRWVIKQERAAGVIG